MTAEPSRAVPPRPASSAGSVPAQPAPPEITPGAVPEVAPETTPMPETTPPPEAPAGPAAAASPASAPVPPLPGSEPASASTEAGSAAAKPTGEGPSSPTKVRIETPGATIEIEANESLAEVVTTALRLFHEAGGWPKVNTRAAGFAQAERRETHPAQPSSMPYAPGSYPVQLP